MSATDPERNGVSPEALGTMLGTEIGRSDWMTIDQTMIDSFAELTGDRQFIHVDPDRARAETPFGGAVAHGFLTLSLLSKMADEALPSMKGSIIGINYGFDKVRFLSPVPAGSSIRGRFRLMALDERRPGEVTSTYEVHVEIDGQEKPAIAAEWLIRDYIKPPGA